tara:strand:+ start:3148 stop:4029 length:882 start_codon:yes stop_codon:yes gene_type:complete
MELLIVSGQSGSGKSTCLNILEDIGYHCIDNMPLNLLIDLVKSLNTYNKLAIGIDARTLIFNNKEQNNNFFIDIIKKIKTNDKININIIYITSTEQAIVKRFNETKRKHPLISLTNKITSLIDALQLEQNLLQPIASIANYTIDSSLMSPYDLQKYLYDRLRHQQKLNILIQSFGFKHGIPLNSNYVFDIRFIPNPYWDEELRGFTGKNQKIINFLKSQKETKQTIDNMINFMNFIIKETKKNNRYYINISIGCTGGQHRSVYIADTISNLLNINNTNINTLHRDLIISDART